MDDRKLTAVVEGLLSRLRERARSGRPVELSSDPEVAAIERATLRAEKEKLDRKLEERVAAVVEEVHRREEGDALDALRERGRRALAGEQEERDER